VRIAAVFILAPNYPDQACGGANQNNYQDNRFRAAPFHDELTFRLSSNRDPIVNLRFLKWCRQHCIFTADFTMKKMNAQWVNAAVAQDGFSLTSV
jgi:hypothetical protein